MSKLQILRNAVQTAIKNGCPRSAISVPAWALSYSVSQKHVREVWEAELTKATNSNQMAEGK
jgi:hypothetical protein